MFCPRTNQDVCPSDRKFSVAKCRNVCDLNSRKCVRLGLFSVYFARWCKFKMSQLRIGSAWRNNKVELACYDEGYCGNSVCFGRAQSFYVLYILLPRLGRRRQQRMDQIFLHGFGSRYDVFARRSYFVLHKQLDVESWQTGAATLSRIDYSANTDPPETPNTLSCPPLPGASIYVGIYS